MLFSKDFLSVFGIRPGCNYDHYGTFGRQLDPWKGSSYRTLPDEIKEALGLEVPLPNTGSSARSPSRITPLFWGNTAHLGSKMRQLSQSEKDQR